MITQFGLWKRNKSGYNTCCKQCNAKRTRKYQLERKVATDKIKLLSGCKDCGYDSHPEALAFDHLPGHTKVANVSRLVAQNASWERIEAEIFKCEVVCANCHAVRTANRRLEGD